MGRNAFGQARARHTVRQNAAHGQDWCRQKRTSAKRASVHVLVHERRGIDHNSPQKIVRASQFGDANRSEEDLRFGFGEVPRVRRFVGSSMRISEWQMHGDVPMRKIQRRKQMRNDLDREEKIENIANIVIITLWIVTWVVTAILCAVGVID